MRIGVFRIKFEPRDLWIGMYWTFKRESTFSDYTNLRLYLYLCVIPMFPLVVRIDSGKDFAPLQIRDSQDI